MENKKNEIKIGMILNYLSMAIEGIVIFFLNPFIIRKLGQETYGIYTLMTSLSGYLSLFELGLGTTIVRFLSKYNAENNVKDRDTFLSMTFIIYFIITLFIIGFAVILYYSIGNLFSKSLSLEQIELARSLFIIIASSITITTIGSIFSAIISGYEKFIFLRTVTLITSILNVLLTILVLIYVPSAINLTYITLIIAALTIIINSLYVFIYLKVKLKIKNWNSKKFHEIFKFTFFVFLQTLIGQIYWRLDQLIIGIQIKDAAIPLAIYAVAMKINDLILAFTTVINRYQLPIITKLTLIEKDEKKLLNHISQTSRFVGILYFAVIIGFIFFGKYFIYLYAGKDYSLAYPITCIVVFSASLNRIHGCGADVLKAKNSHGLYTAIIFMTSLLNVLLTIILIPKFGILGASIGTALSMIIGNTIAYYWCLNKKANINLKELFAKTFKGFGYIIVIPIPICLLLNLLKDNIIIYIIKILAFLFIYFITIYKFILDRNTKMYIKRKLHFKNFM